MSSRTCPHCGTIRPELAPRCACGFDFPPSTVRPISSASKNKADIRPEIQTARKVYRWLWISPLVTLPTLAVFSFVFEDMVLATLISGLSHLVLLIPALKGKTIFIRWHGRQAIFLAAIRTGVMLLSAAVVCASLGILLVIFLWLAGNLWGQNQAGRGDCSLMRWLGRGGDLPVPIVREAAEGVSGQHLLPMATIDELVQVVRFDPDPQKLQKALAKLDQLGLVEPL